MTDMFHNFHENTRYICFFCEILYLQTVFKRVQVHKFDLVYCLKRLTCSKHIGFLKTVHYLRPIPPNEAQSALIGPLAHFVVIGQAPPAHIGSVWVRLKCKTA